MAQATPAISRRFVLRNFVIGSLTWLWVGVRGRFQLLGDARSIGLLLFLLTEDFGFDGNARRIERERQDGLDHVARILEALGHPDQRSEWPADAEVHDQRDLL